MKKPERPRGARRGKGTNIYTNIYILIFERAYLLLHTQNHLKCFLLGFFGRHCGVWLRHWYWDSLVRHNYSPCRWRGTFEGHAPSTRRPNYCLMNHQISFPCANYSDTSSKFRKMTACCTPNWRCHRAGCPHVLPSANPEIFWSFYLTLNLTVMSFEMRFTSFLTRHRQASFANVGSNLSSTWVPVAFCAPQPERLFWPLNPEICRAFFSTHATQWTLSLSLCVNPRDGRDVDDENLSRSAAVLWLRLRHAARTMSTALKVTSIPFLSHCDVQFELHRVVLHRCARLKLLPCVWLIWVSE